MQIPSNCPYRELSAKPCWTCQWHNADMDECGLNGATATQKSWTAQSCASTYEERMQRYWEDRRKLLELSKESLVDLILKRPII